MPARYAERGWDICCGWVGFITPGASAGQRLRERLMGLCVFGC
jgi:hypothetical protein